MENLLQMFDWAQLIPILLGIAVVWKYAHKILIALKEVAELLAAVSESLLDQKLTPEEKALIAREAKEAIAALKAIFGKKK